jgi:hypothetical protein
MTPEEEKNKGVNTTAATSRDPIREEWRGNRQTIETTDSTPSDRSEAKRFTTIRTM